MCFVLCIIACVASTCLFLCSLYISARTPGTDESPTTTTMRDIVIAKDSNKWTKQSRRLPRPSYDKPFDPNRASIERLVIWHTSYQIHPPPYQKKLKGPRTPVVCDPCKVI